MSDTVRDPKSACFIGGAERDRTVDLLDAIAASLTIHAYPPKLISLFN
jgi:hypothetical protein